MLQKDAPNLSQISDVTQAIDTWQVRRGNPDLDAFNTLSQSITGGFSYGIIGLDLQLGYDYEYHPIMESIFFENNLFVRTYENQKSFQNISAEANFKIRPWKNYINISIAPRVNRFISHGNTYLHTYTMPELRINVDFMYKHWLASYTTITPPRSMYGEQLMKSDQRHTLMAGYKQNKWSVMVGVLDPFSGKYNTENKDWSALNPINSSIHTQNNRLFLVRLNFNINTGKQFAGSKKRINNSDSDDGIMQGVKN